MYPRFLQFGLLVISTYGVLALVAALCFASLWTRIARRTGLAAGEHASLIVTQLHTTALLSVTALFVGARIAVVAANWRTFLEAPLLVLLAGTLHTGSAAWWGLLLAITAGCLSLRNDGLPLLPSLDAAAPALAVAAAVLDMADFAAGSQYGSPTQLPWAVTYTSRFAARTTGVPLGVPLHPVQIYAALAHFSMAVLLIALLRQGRRSREVFGIGLFAEGALRFLLAPLHGTYADATALLHVVTPQQATGMLMVAIGGAFWLRRKQHNDAQVAAHV